MLRAIAAPHRFLSRGFPRAVARARGTTEPARLDTDNLCVALPRDLARFLHVVGDAPFGHFDPDDVLSMLRMGFPQLLAEAPRTAKPILVALLAGMAPFGRAPSGDLWVHALGGGTLGGGTPSERLVITLEPLAPYTPRFAYRDPSTFALACALHDAAQSEPQLASSCPTLLASLPSPDPVDHDRARLAFERAHSLLDVLVGDDLHVRRGAQRLAQRSCYAPELPPTERKPTGGNRRPLAFASLVEAFFRNKDERARTICASHISSTDLIVAEAAQALCEAIDSPNRTALGAELARRRRLTLGVRPGRPLRSAALHRGERAALTWRIVEQYDKARAPAEQRQEALLALRELGDDSAVAHLTARALSEDVGAVHMLGALGRSNAVPTLVELLKRSPPRSRALEAAAVRALASLGARGETGLLRDMLTRNPMSNWKEGIEREPLVRELVRALGILEDREACPLLRALIKSNSQEYRRLVPLFVWAVGKAGTGTCMETLVDQVISTREVPSCEALWALGAIGARCSTWRHRARALLEGHANLEPAAEVVRLTALAKLQRGKVDRERVAEAIGKALWEPAFRQDETSRRRTWALNSLYELAQLGINLGAFQPVSDQETVRYFVTRGDHRVREAAERAFRATGILVPTTHRYFCFLMEELESAGLEALHRAVGDPLGVFRHNVVARLAERGDSASVLPMARATARLFAEPPTSTYDYDDSPKDLVTFVKALARLNAPEGNDVLIEGLRSGHHQVRAVVAEYAPADRRFVPELMGMVGDPRSFLRVRAERSLSMIRGGERRPGPLAMHHVLGNRT